MSLFFHSWFSFTVVARQVDRFHRVPDRSASQRVSPVQKMRWNPWPWRGIPSSLDGLGKVEDEDR